MKVMVHHPMQERHTWNLFYTKQGSLRVLDGIDSRGTENYHYNLDADEGCAFLRQELKWEMPNRMKQ